MPWVRREGCSDATPDPAIAWRAPLHAAHETRRLRAPARASMETARGPLVPRPRRPRARGRALRRCRRVLDWPLLRRVRGPRRPPGSLVAVDATGSMLPPTLDDLGTRVQLVYVDVEELALQNPGGERVGARRLF